MNQQNPKKLVDKAVEKLDGEWRYSCRKPRKHRRLRYRSSTLGARSPNPAGCALPASYRELWSTLGASNLPGRVPDLRTQNEGAVHHGKGNDKVRTGPPPRGEAGTDQQTDLELPRDAR